MADTNTDANRQYTDMDTGLYYIVRDGVKSGPYTEAQMGHMWRSGAITADCFYSLEHSDNLRSVLELESKETTTRIF
jgi:hypothetical protein